MDTTPRDPNDAPRSDEPRRSDDATVPDQGDLHDVPDDEVIEQTLPKRDKPGS